MDLGVVTAGLLCVYQGEMVLPTEKMQIFTLIHDTQTWACSVLRAELLLPAVARLVVVDRFICQQ